MTAADRNFQGATCMLISLSDEATFSQITQSKAFLPLSVFSTRLLGNILRSAKGSVSKIICTLLLSFGVSVLTASAQTTVPLTSCSQMGIGQGASLNGFRPFPLADPWNEDITSLPVDSLSANVTNFFGAAGLHADFGAGTINGAKFGIPYQVVSAQPFVPVNYVAYGSESDQGPMPIPANAPVEGAGLPSSQYSDNHVLILDQSNCFLYELYQGQLQGDGSWNAASGAIFDLLADSARPFNWTSADAAGLPIFPGLIRYDEVASGAIRHAIRFTLDNTRGSFILPATHQTSNSGSFAPFGARFRLKASFDISSYSAANQVILQAMKTYGLILADNGSNMYITGAPDSRWNNDDLVKLGAVKMSSFEMVDSGTLYTPNSVPTNPQPVITALTATTSVTSISKVASVSGGAATARMTTTKATLASGATVAKGTAVTFTWTATDANYYVFSPGGGAVRGSTVTVTPTVTTTYTLYANSHIGSATKTFTIKVQ